MKKIFTIICCYLFSLNLFSQDRCGTEEYLEILQRNNPNIINERIKLEKDLQRWIQNRTSHKQNTIITVPVVVHVVYSNNQQNISDQQIQTQIDVLNNDFRRTNVDAIMTPNIWTSIAADCEIEFCLATIDPNGNITNGITRTQTSNSSFSITNNNIKSTSNGGKDAWPNNDYLNLWVCNLSGGLLGYATPPTFGAIGQNDGVVIDYTNFGTIGTAQSPFNKGRTATHEVGHWLNLDHVWGNGNCGNDNVSDTPIQEEANYGCPSFPHNINSCNTSNSNGDMFMNYMDYTNDGCMNFFTNGQKTRMIAAINQSRQNLLNHNLCTGSTQPCSPIAINTSNQLNEGFQNGVLANNWSINNPDNDKTWEINNNTGYNSNSSIYINNADYPANGQIDDLILPPMDFTSSSISNITLAFDYAYLLWTDPNASQVWSDTLQIWVSNDCGISWNKIWDKSGLNLVTNNTIFTGAAWAPSTNNDWNSEVINLNNYLNEDDFMLKFRNINDYENNLFIDNINISASSSSNVNQIESSNKTLIKIVDFLGRNTQKSKQGNTVLFYIYDDGTVVKKYTIN
tara:strand:+ start:3 stop:1709 length:1707 start_codon:yes stop_codon:yes gene_type:complete